MMWLFTRDCLLFKPHAEMFFRDFNSSIPYEKLQIILQTDSCTKITYTWYDPLKIRDKIIAKDKKTVSLLYMRSKNLLFCFGKSESEIGFVIRRIEKIFQINLEKVDLFSNHSKYVSSELTSIHIQIAKDVDNYDIEDSRLVPLRISEIPNDILQGHFESGLITLLTFKYSQDNKVLTYFYLDKGSVITFPDNVKEDVVYNVLENAIKIP